MTNLAEFTLTEPLYEGQYTVIHRGYRNSGRTPVVVKLLRSESPSAREVARLRHEYLICRDLDVPGVVRILALHRIGSTVALIMEDFGGRSLVDIIRARRLDLKTALQIATSIAESLGAIHERRIIHKDIKPHNILVNEATGVVKLTDFGIATRLSQESHKETTPDALEGTLAYLSPEQTGRMNRVLDYRTDFYSFGVTLYEMLTGTLPFTTTDPIELVHSHIARTPPSPRERSREIPEVVSAVVMKLLAKAAEDRYQSAHGLKADLDECLARLDATGTIASFPLGKKDVSGTLSIAQKLYGREADTAALLAAFERVSRGGAELLLVSGYAGVGKSSLVSEIHQAIGRRGGRFTAGKFDQMSRNIPYTAVVTALRELVHHRLAEPEEALVRWKRDLLAAAGGNGQVLVDLIPELALVLGQQPSISELGPAEAQNRFNLVFQNLIRVFTTADHPLVLFLDDLQWADPASLKLLALLLLDPDRGYLLIIGAYRDHEVGPGHLLSITLDELRRDGAQMSDIRLLPLGLSDITQLLADTLGCERAQVAPLAQVVFEKTDGNPFFLAHLLKSLHAEGCITFRREAGVWTWDLERIRAADVTDNVVELMSGKIARLSPETRRVLVLAACIGHQFDLQTLAVISEISPAEAAIALWGALREGLVLPLDSDYRFLSEVDDEKSAHASPQAFNVQYRFLHDRVQQAAYASIDERHKQEIHLQIGRGLRDRYGAAEREEQLFTIVDHLNVGASLIADRSERIGLAELNVAAGKRAKAATAYQAAYGYLEAAAEFVDEACWEQVYPLSFALHIELAECAYLNGHFERAESLFASLLSHAKSKLDRAEVYRMCVLLATTRGDFAGAIRFGRAGLALFGITIPETDEQQKNALDAEFATLRANLSGCRIEELIHAPLLVDPELRTALELLVQISPPSFFTSFTLSALVAILQTNFCLKHGRSDLAAFSYAYASETHVMPFGQFKEGREFFRLSCALDELFATPALVGKTNVVLVSVAHFFISFRDVLRYVARGQRAALSAGDFLFLSFTCYHDVMPRLCAGEELSSVRDVLQKNFALAYRTKSELVIATLVIARQMIAALEGHTKHPTSLSDESYDEAAHLAELQGNVAFGFALSWLHTVKMQLLYLHGDHEAALAQAALATATAGGTSVFHYWTDVPFFSGLSLAALSSSASGAERDRYAAQLAEHQAQIGIWAESCPENYRHKQLLLGAEAARIAGKYDEAEELYEQAIDAARDNDAIHHEAMAHELVAQHYLRRGRQRLARVSMNDARQGYLRWGAAVKAADLTAKYADLFGAAAIVRKPGKGAETTITDGTEGLDTAAMVRAAQAIAAEIELEALLDRLMRILVANAGADRGVLLLVRGGQLVVEAIMTVEPDIVRVGLATPLAAFADLAVNVVQFVQRTMDPVVLGDATRSGSFSKDPYLATRPPKSLLCLSMAKSGRVAGIVYLENHAVREAFTPARVEVAGILLSQAAIAVENAVLVAELKRRTEALSESNAALGQANESLRSANVRLEQELGERSNAERVRAELVAELLRVQTPFIPISDNVVVMPLIGAIDANRANQVLETALRGVESSGARVVILDVTGVKLIDASITHTLLNVARALRLLGAHTIMTGIQPHMARSLVELNMDLADVVTRGTLQSGIAHAMTLLNRQAGRNARR